MASPILSPITFDKLDSGRTENSGERQTMTVAGTSQKGLLCCLIVLASSIIASRCDVPFSGFLFVVLVDIFLIAAIYFQPKTAFFLTPLFSVCQGFSLGMLAKLLLTMAAADYNDPNGEGVDIWIHGEAVFCSVCSAIIMSSACGLGLIKAKHTGTFIFLGCITGPFLFYGAAIAANMCGYPLILMHSSYLILGAIISAVFCWAVSYCLALDFDNIRVGMLSEAPKSLEWYCAFALIFTLTWCYIEIIKLLAVMIIEERDDSW